MHILILSPFLPHPPNWGFGKRVYHLLEVLSRSHSVSLLTYADERDAESIQALKAFCVDVHTVPTRSFRFGKRIAQLLFGTKGSLTRFRRGDRPAGSRFTTG